METISVIEAAERLRKGGTCLIDVRSPAEFGAQHAVGAINIPLDRLTVDALRRQAASYSSVMFICQRGGRSKQACERIGELGLSQAATVAGGTDAWIAAQLPAQMGAPVMSLERQVRISAGILVVVGIALNFLVSQWFLALSAFVGAGLIFAGVTDTCGMAFLLGRMPWNQRSGASC